MTNDAIQAIVKVQERLMRTTKVDYRSSRLERTEDYLLSKPDRTGDPDTMVYNAWGSAGKVERRRQKQHAPTPERDLSEHLALDGRYSLDHNVDYNVIAILDFVERVQLGNRERTVLMLLAKEKDVEEIAEYLGVTKNYAKVLICRTRQQAKALWEVA